MLVSLLTACASTGASHKTGDPEVNLNKISEELAEPQLLDVWIELFDPGKLPQDKEDTLGLSHEIREAEARYIPIHLREVIEKTGYWGAVRVVPYHTEGAEVLVRGVILSSDGTQLELEISAEDASGRVWFNKTYQGEVDSTVYKNTFEDFEPFQSVYRLIANDLAQFRNGLSDQDRIKIRQYANVRFAADMAPDAFANHIQRNDNDLYQLNRLPAENDPAFQRVLLIRERDFLFIDVLNGHFDNYYIEMEYPYLEWRKARNYEEAAIAELKQDSNKHMILGAAAILGAIALEVMGGSDARAATNILRDVMVIGGAVAIKKGFDIRGQSSIHQAAIEELGDSFSNETKPLVVEVDDEIYELTGSAEVQYQQWRELMREIYASELGLDTITTSMSSDN